MLSERQNKLLNIIIREHIKNAHPVGSTAVVDKYGLDLSPATIRNEMKELEEKGYIFQPHTSAGRVPTEKGWKYYLEYFLDEREISETQRRELTEAFAINSEEPEAKIKNLAKKLAKISRETVIVAFNPDYVYYTGLSNLFRQPEFSEYELICRLSEVIDHLDEVVSYLFREIETDDFRVMIGQENPFGEDCAAIVTKYLDKNGQAGIFSILGPLRMSYEKNLALLKHSYSLIKSA